MGQIIAQDWKSYQYLVESIRQFPDQVSFCNLYKKTFIKKRALLYIASISSVFLMLLGKQLVCLLNAQSSKGEFSEAKDTRLIKKNLFQCLKNRLHTFGLPGHNVLLSDFIFL